VPHWSELPPSDQIFTYFDGESATRVERTFAASRLLATPSSSPASSQSSTGWSGRARLLTFAGNLLATVERKAEVSWNGEGEEPPRWP
jgi:hypothetical protein